MRKKAILYYGLGIFFCLSVLLPIYFLIVLSVSGRDAVYAWPKIFYVANLDWSMFRFFFEVEGVTRAMFNSVLVASLTVVFAIGLGTPAAYALARYNFFGKNFYRIAILFTRAFPVAILALPLTVRFINLGIYDTIWAVVIVHTALALPFSILIQSNLFQSVPKELEEAAWLLGCTKLQAFFKIMLPICMPSVAATAIFAFIISWNEVFAAAVLTVKNRTLTAFLISQISESPLFFQITGSFFLVIPTLFFIFIVRKYLFSLWGITNK